jgi:hypothetical protein
MVPEQDRKIRDSETEKGGDGSCREEKDAGEGPDQGRLVYVPHEYSPSCIYTQSFAIEPDVLSDRDGNAWIVYPCEFCDSQQGCCFAAEQVPYPASDIDTVRHRDPDTQYLREYAGI